VAIARDGIEFYFLVHLEVAGIHVVEKLTEVKEQPVRTVAAFDKAERVLDGADRTLLPSSATWSSDHNLATSFLA